jgi:organic radical activating enzyme
VTTSARAHARALKVSELFESVQGEGATAGQPAVFLRLANCNLHCTWCDTKYSWDWNSYRYRDQVTTRPIADLALALGERRARRLVVTGGEPLLQQSGLEGLLERIGSEWLVEIETNGTQEPSATLLARVDQWNVSVKLSNSGNRESLRLRPAALARLRDSGRAWLKLVVATEGDVAEADALRRSLGWPEARVLLMPQAATRDELALRMPRVAELAAARGYRVSPRLHIELFGGRRGQ